MHNMSSYITAFCRAASHVVGITDNEILDRFVMRLKPKIMNMYCYHKQIPLKKACVASIRVGIVFMNIGSSNTNPLRL